MTGAQADETSTTATDAVIETMRRQVDGGRPWCEALLEAISRWEVAEETIADRRYRYLIGGEAFDWLLLAERLCYDLNGTVPPAEKEALLFYGRLPMEMNEDEFRRFIGHAKYRAHLNYFYGILVEEAIHLAVEEELHKERRSRAWPGRDFSMEQEGYQRIYGRSRDELLAEFRKETAMEPADSISLGDLQEFTYWLFKYRLRCADPARIASDTQRGMAALARMRNRVAQLHSAKLTGPAGRPYNGPGVGI